MSGKVWLVVGREYREHVAKKSFWIGLAVGPIFFAGIFALQYLAFKMAPDVQKSVAIVDHSGRIFDATAAALAADSLKNGQPEFIVSAVAPEPDSAAQVTALNQRVAAEELYGYLLVGENVEARGAFRFYTRNVGNALATDKIESAVNKALVGVRLVNRNISLTQQDLETVTKGASLVTYKVTKEGKATRRDFGGTYIAAFIFAMILLMSIITYGVTALRGILEEKSSRIIEVLLSSVTPFELMMGKIIGISLVGLTQIGTYAVTGGALSLYGLSAPSTGMLGRIMAAFTPATMAFFVLYFLLGFVLFLAVFAAIGSMVNSEQEAQHMQQPVVWALVIPMYATFFFINSPDALLTRIVSLFPFFTPMVMLMRITVMTPPWWEIALSVVIMLATIVGVIWVVARIFRVGILMYGKRPSLPEIARWVKSE